MLSTDQITAFIAAAEHGSFSAAARSLNKAQSAVSHAIQNLEIDLGVELFDRSARSPSLTPAGKALLRKAHALQQTRQEFIAQAASLNGANETEICLAIARVSGICPCWKFSGSSNRNTPMSHWNCWTRAAAMLPS